MVVNDDTSMLERNAKELSRVDRGQLPVNLLYPPNYPEEPAILLEELISPADVLEALGRLE
jgi:hypothetical protein